MLALVTVRYLTLAYSLHQYSRNTGYAVWEFRVSNLFKTEIAKRLIVRGASITLARHFTQLPKTALLTIKEEVRPTVPPARHSGSMDAFFKAYGPFVDVTVDVISFVNAVEATNVSPDLAFQKLRAEQMRQLANPPKIVARSAKNDDQFVGQYDLIAAIG